MLRETHWALFVQAATAGQFKRSGDVRELGWGTLSTVCWRPSGERRRPSKDRVPITVLVHLGLVRVPSYRATAYFIDRTDLLCGEAHVRPSATETTTKLAISSGLWPFSMSEIHQTISYRRSIPMKTNINQARLVRLLLALPLLTLPSCRDVPPMRPSVPTVQLGDTIAIFPSKEDSVTLSNVWSLALATGEKSVYVLDIGEKMVHHIDLDGNLFASMGGEGSGPGEFEAPLAMQPSVEGGVLVIDTKAQRITHFAANGNVEGVIVTENLVAGSFSPTEDGVLLPPVAPLDHTDAILVGLDTTTGASEVRRYEFGNPPVVPDLLAESNWYDRLYGWKLGRISANEIAIVLNGATLRGWRLFLDHDHERIDSTVELSTPSDVQRDLTDADNMVSEPDARLNPLQRIGIAAGKLWVVSPGLADGPLAFTIPLEARDEEIRLPKDLSDQQEMYDDVIDVIVLSNRVIMAIADEVVIRDRLPDDIPTVAGKE